MVEVFKTNVVHHEDASVLISKLAALFPGSKVTFDLEDCDNILRIEGQTVIAGRVISMLNAHNYLCHMLDT